MLSASTALLKYTDTDESSECIWPHVLYRMLTADNKHTCLSIAKPHVCMEKLLGQTALSVLEINASEKPCNAICMTSKQR